GLDGTDHISASSTLSISPAENGSTIGDPSSLPSTTPLTSDKTTESESKASSSDPRSFTFISLEDSRQVNDNNGVNNDDSLNVSGTTDDTNDFEDLDQDYEHLQLSLEEAFFLVFAVECIAVL